MKANSYLIRKGLSRKAQLCHYLNKHVAKHPTSVLRAAVPSSMAIETWVRSGTCGMPRQLTKPNITSGVLYAFIQEVYEDDMTFLGAK